MEEQEGEMVFMGEAGVREEEVRLWEGRWKGAPAGRWISPDPCGGGEEWSGLLGEKAAWIRLRGIADELQRGAMPVNHTQPNCSSSRAHLNHMQCVGCVAGMDEVGAEVNGRRGGGSGRRGWDPHRRR